MAIMMPVASMIVAITMPYNDGSEATAVVLTFVTVIDVVYVSVANDVTVSVNVTLLK